MDPRIDAGDDIYQLTGVSKTYRKSGREILAVRELDLCIKTGEWLAVQGKTGHGKTTLLQLLGGLDRPTAGRVAFAGQDLARAPETRVRKVRASSFGFIFQTFNLVPTLTAHENVEAALIPLGVRHAERRARVTAALDSVGLADREPGRGHQGRDHRPAQHAVARAPPDPGPGQPRQQRDPPRPADRGDVPRPAIHPPGHPGLLMTR
jgi:putative ABC transport system ATP-binding protein